MTVEIEDRHGWEVVRIGVDPLEVDVVPGKGGDILAVRWQGTNLLWESPWGLRARGDPPDAPTSAGRWLQMYPGGWQTIFPNGGDPSDGHGFHGEACLVPYAYELGDDEIELRARVGEFAVRRRLLVRGDGVEVEETIRNESLVTRDAMWSHHPAFGAPFLSGACRVECDAERFVADDARDVPAGDLEPGAESGWPHARTRDGGTADLSVIPPDGPPVDRFGYLTGFARGRAAIMNAEMGLRVTLEWDAAPFPCAWYWLEARATRGDPWHGKAYVFAIEPASTWPGQGLAVARTKGNGTLRFEPGEAKTARIRLSAAAF